MNKLSVVVLSSLAVVTVIFGTIYVTQQQNLRMGAHETQVELAENTAATLNRGVPATNAVTGKVDMANSLSSFVIIYDKSGKVISGNGYLNGKIPTVPIGVLLNSKGKDYSFVTWQPDDNVRIAAVSVAAKEYYVLSGRSLKEVEKRVDSLLGYVLFGWFASIAFIIGGTYIFSLISRKRIR